MTINYHKYYLDLVKKARQAKRNAAARAERNAAAREQEIRKLNELHELRERLRRVEAASKKKRNNEKKARSYFF